MAKAVPVMETSADQALDAALAADPAKAAQALAALAAAEAPDRPQDRGEPVTIRLRHPIRIIDTEPAVESITIRPCRAKDVRRLPLIAGLEVDAMLTLAGRLSGHVEAVIDRLEDEDLAEVLEAVKVFMQRCRLIGSES